MVRVGVQVVFFFCSGVAERDQLVEVDVFPVPHFAYEALWKYGEVSTDKHLFCWFVS